MAINHPLVETDPRKVRRNWIVNTVGYSVLLLTFAGIALGWILEAVK